MCLVCLLFFVCVLGVRLLCVRLLSVVGVVGVCVIVCVCVGERCVRVRVAMLADREWERGRVAETT